MLNLILFPSSYFSARQIDEALQYEYEAVLATGLFEIALFSYDKWVSEGRLALHNAPSEPSTALMRGWMMKPEQYKPFYEELLKNNIRLVTSPEEYELMHIFPNVYERFGLDTAKMKLYPLHQQINVEEVKKHFNRFMVKDYVKSVKGTDFPRFFDNSVTQEEFDRQMELFYKYRGDLLTGGICIKEFLDLKLWVTGGRNTN